jgi:hypothetical protein
VRYIANHAFHGRTFKGEGKLSKSVFISHAAQDKALVQEIVSLIEEGIGMPERCNFFQAPVCI